MLLSIEPTFEPLNGAPYLIEPLGDIAVDEDATATTFSLADLFDDPDLGGGDSLTYTLSLSTPVESLVEAIGEPSYTHIHQDLLYTHTGDDRGFGAEHDPARENIVDYFTGLGLETSLEAFTYGSGTYYNVVAVQPGVTTPEDVYIVGAHYDSMSTPGADDNASGTAAVMEIARLLSQHTFDSTLVYIAFDREEQGLYGSSAYVQEHSGDNILGMVNLDMIAYNPDGASHDGVAFYESRVGGAIKGELADAFGRYAPSLTVDDTGVTGRSDHAPFEEAGFDAVLVIEQQWQSNPNYHQSTDAVETPDYIDYAYATQIGGGVLGYLAEHAGLVGSRLAFARVNGDQLTVFYNGNRSGAVDVTVRATDSGGLWVEDTFRVTVQPVADPPTVGQPLPDIEVAVDATETVVDLAAVFADPDAIPEGDFLTFTAASTDPALVSTAVDGTTLTLSYPSGESGVAEVTVRATDTAGAWVEDTFEVVVGAPTAQIRGTKWDDRNGDGVWDAGEPGLAGVTIFLDLDENGQLDDGEPSTVTREDDPSTPEDETGTYAFADVAAGEYLVREVVPAGWTQTSPLAPAGGSAPASTGGDAGAAAAPFTWTGWEPAGDATVAGFATAMDFSFDGVPLVADSVAGAMVTLAGEQTWVAESEPIVPVRPTTILLPQGTAIGSVVVEPGAGVALAAGIQLAAPVAAAVFSEAAQTSAGLTVLGADFPGTEFVRYGTHLVNGYSVATLDVFPVQYDAASGSLTYYPDLTVELTTEELDASQVLPVRASEADRLRVAGMVANAEDLDGYTAAGSGGFQATSDLPAGGPLEYVIITSAALADAFQPLVDEKISRGLAAGIVTTDYVYNNYTGTENHDNADKIRQFIADAYANWNTRWVLLGGDKEVIPYRGTYGSESGTYTDDDIPTDLYFAALDGPWDHDGDGIWGERNDGSGGGDVDLVADVYVGRAPVSTLADVGHFVAKTVLYETTPHPNATTAVMASEKLDGETYGSYSMIPIAEDLIPSDWTVLTYYDSDATWTKSDLVAELNASPHLVNHLGHSTETVNARLHRSDVDALVNEFPYFLYSQGCDAGAFDYTDAIGEHHVTAEHGAFAVIMNSRYGWYMPGTVPDANHHWHYEFLDAVLNEGILGLAEAHEDSRQDNLWRVGSTGAERWIHFALTLLGDPETSFQLEAGGLEPAGRVVSLGPGEIVEGVDFGNHFNYLPQAGDDAHETAFETTLSVPAPGVLANDVDLNGDDLSALLASGPQHGSLTLHSDGSFTYSPNSGYHGPDAFTYVAYDGQDESDPATVALTVYPSEEVLPWGDLAGPVAGQTTIVDRGYVDIAWEDGGTPPSGIDPATVDTGDLRIESDGFDLSIDRVELLGNGIYRYVYGDDGESLAAGTVTVTLVGGEVADQMGNGNVEEIETFIYDDSVPAPSLDVDASGEADALTDGILVLRYLFGFAGETLVADAVDAGGGRTDPVDIAAYIEAGRETMLDVDDNGEADALTDGIVILRYLFGFTGPALVEDAVDPAGNRTHPDDIQSFLAAYLPSAPGEEALSAQPLVGLPVAGAGRASGEPDRGFDEAAAMTAVAFEPPPTFGARPIVASPQPIDPAGGKYGPSPGAVDRMLTAQAAPVEVRDPAVEEVAMFHLNRISGRRSSAHRHLEELFAAGVETGGFRESHNGWRPLIVLERPGS